VSAAGDLALDGAVTDLQRIQQCWSADDPLRQADAPDLLLRGGSRSQGAARLSGSAVHCWYSAASQDLEMATNCPTTWLEEFRSTYPTAPARWAIEHQRRLVNVDEGLVDCRADTSEFVQRRGVDVAVAAGFLNTCFMCWSFARVDSSCK